MAQRVLILFWFAALMATGSTVWGTSAAGELTGSRDSTSGQVTEESGLGTDVTISWVISQDGTVYDYTYTINGPTGSGLGVSHFALNLSNTCTTDANCVTGALVNGLDVESTLVYGPNNSSKGDTNYPGNFYGVRFFPVATQLPIVVQFTSDRAPDYGDFFLKLGSGGPTNGDSAWNNGSNSVSDTSGVTTDYIPVPGSDLASEIPEPGTMLLCAFGLMALAFVLRTPGNARARI